MAEEEVLETTAGNNGMMTDIVIQIPTNQIDVAMGVMDTLMSAMQEAMASTSTQKAEDERELSSADEEALVQEIEGLTRRS